MKVRDYAAKHDLDKNTQRRRNAMPADYDVITFDCYGTLIDWDRGIAEALVTAARAAGVTLDPGPALAAYHEVEPTVQAGAYRPYREVLAEVAHTVASRLGWTLDTDAAWRFAESLPGWPPFPDTNGALERLAAAGYRLGILSNVDDDLLRGTIGHFTAPIDLIVTAEQVRSYKPAHGHFMAARERIGGLRWLHAAESHFHDVIPATALGIPVVWVNRTGAPLPPLGPAPLAEVATLAEFADWLLEDRRSRMEDRG
jgi:2-haloacid dehalogenase/putative hydrolase of the HAD superfamily